MAGRPTGAASDHRVRGEAWPGWYAEAVGADQANVDLSEHAAFIARLAAQIALEWKLGEQLLEHMKQARVPFGSWINDR